MINGYPQGSDITIMNTMYHRGEKNGKTGKYSDDHITMVFKDNTTGQKQYKTIYKPEYTYYKTDETVGYNRFFIESEKVIPISVPYKDLEKSIAENTGRMEEYYDNIKCGNWRANKILHLDEKIFNSDMHIENYYRKKFAETYKNDIPAIDKAYLDIETNVRYIEGDFPKLGEAPINAVSVMIDKANTLYTFILREKDNPLIEKFENDLKSPNSDFIARFKVFLEQNVGGWKNLVRFKLDKLQCKLIFFDDEVDLLVNLFRLINITQPDFVMAWNMAFDIPYIIERLKILGVDPAKVLCHPDFKEKFCNYFIDERHKNDYEARGDYADIASYSVYLDQLIQFASRRKGQSAFQGNALDDIGESVCKVRKLDWKHITTDFGMFPYLDFETFIMYSMMDPLVQKCIEEKTGDINYTFSKAIANNTIYAKVHRQTVYLADRAVSSFLKNNDVIAGNNCNKFNEKPTSKFSGAFVADPLLISDNPKVKINGVPIMLYRNANDFDYKRLYPSLAQEFNQAPNTQVGMIEIPEQIYWNENPNNNDKFSRAGTYVENLASRNYLEFCRRWLHLGSYREVYDDIVEYFTKVRTPISGSMHLELSRGMQDVVFRVHPGQTLTVVSRFDGKVVSRYLPMPKEVEEKVQEYRKAMSL